MIRGQYNVNFFMFHMIRPPDLLRPSLYLLKTFKITALLQIFQRITWNKLFTLKSFLQGNGASSMDNLGILRLSWNFYIYNNNNILTAIRLLPGDSSSVHAHNYEKGATNLKPGALHEKHAVATWSVGNHLSICL